MKILIKLFALVSIILHSCGESKGSPLEIYVSSSTGSDSNSGTERNPLRTIKAAIDKAPESIYLKKGDTFYERVDVIGFNLKSYSKGDKPIISGLKILEENSWERGWFEDNIWVQNQLGNIYRANLSLSDEHYSGFATHGSSMLNNVGQIVEIDSKFPLNSKRVRYPEELRDNFDFWFPTQQQDAKSYKPSDFDYIYVYSDSDLNQKKYGLAVYLSGMVVKDGSVDGIHLSNWGKGGIVVKSNSMVSNCLVEQIGGSFFTNFADTKWTSYGNGIECNAFSGPIENGVVRNCIIRQCYDCGITIQGYDLKKSLYAKNFILSENIIENCFQSMEFYIIGPSDQDKFINCLIQKNISLNPGVDTGFRYYYDRYNKCHILENSNHKTDIQFINNLFINGNYYCATPIGKLYNQPIWQSNFCIITGGQDLIGNYVGTKDLVRLPHFSKKSDNLREIFLKKINRYRELTGDNGTNFLIVDNDYMKKVIRQISKPHDNPVKNIKKYWLMFSKDKTNNLTYYGDIYR